MRGDRPGLGQFADAVGWFTPHARGSTSDHYQTPVCRIVYPACAGIDHSSLFSLRNLASLPRMRGDRPLCGHLQLKAEKFTPHARGSTSARFSSPAAERVYPACAGIDPCEPEPDERSQRLPRMRGDRPL